MSNNDSNFAYIVCLPISQNVCHAHLMTFSLLSTAVTGKQLQQSFVELKAIFPVLHILSCVKSDLPCKNDSAPDIQATANFDYWRNPQGNLLIHASLWLMLASFCPKMAPFQLVTAPLWLMMAFFFCFIRPFPFSGGTQSSYAKSSQASVCKKMIVSSKIAYDRRS